MGWEFVAHYLKNAGIIRGSLFFRDVDWEFKNKKCPMQFI
jgi:hypothetical protein